MPKRKLKLPPLKLESDESFGERLSRIRKEKGFTQVELAEKVGLIQSLITDYELDRIRLNAEMICRFAGVLGITSDELLGLKKAAPVKNDLSLRLVRRMQKFGLLPSAQQKALLQTIDVYLKGAGISA
jgi:transcriptional regulator with XRE-family HTH domain